MDEKEWNDSVGTIMALALRYWDVYDFTHYEKDQVEEHYISLHASRRDVKLTYRWGNSNNPIQIL